MDLPYTQTRYEGISRILYVTVKTNIRYVLLFYNPVKNPSKSKESFNLPLSYN